VHCAESPLLQRYQSDESLVPLRGDARDRATWAQGLSPAEQGHDKRYGRPVDLLHESSESSSSDQDSAAPRSYSDSDAGGGLSYWQVLLLDTRAARHHLIRVQLLACAYMLSHYFYFATVYEQLKWLASGDDREATARHSNDVLSLMFPLVGMAVAAVAGVATDRMGVRASALVMILLQLIFGVCSVIPNVPLQYLTFTAVISARMIVWILIYRVLYAVMPQRTWGAAYGAVSTVASVFNLLAYLLTYVCESVLDNSFFWTNVLLCAICVVAGLWFVRGYSAEFGTKEEGLPDPPTKVDTQAAVDARGAALSESRQTLLRNIMTDQPRRGRRTAREREDQHQGYSSLADCSFNRGRSSHSARVPASMAAAARQPVQDQQGHYHLLDPVQDARVQGLDSV